MNLFIQSRSVFWLGDGLCNPGGSLWVGRVSMLFTWLRLVRQTKWTTDKTNREARETLARRGGCGIEGAAQTTCHHLTHCQLSTLN